MSLDTMQPESAADHVPVAASCPACGHERTHAHRFHAFDATRCLDCGHVAAALDPRAVAALTAHHDAGYQGFAPDPVFGENARRILLGLGVPKGARLLDVGCGAGQFLEIAAAAGLDASGIDVSRDAVTMCRARGLSASVAELPSTDLGSFEVVTMWDVLEHTTRPVELLRSVRSVVAPDGVLIVKTPRTTRRMLWLASVHSTVEQVLLSTRGHVGFFTPRSITAVFARAGWTVRIEEVRRFRQRKPISSPRRAVGEFVRGLGRTAGGSRQFVIYARPTS